MSSFALKWIAVISMFIDHFTYVFIPQGTPAYIVGRSLGRLALPLFVFLVAEGFYYTRNAKKYIMRLSVFAVISEVPFDFAFLGRFTWEYQNVFVTLALGLLMLYLYDKFAESGSKPLALLTVLAAALAAWLAKSDYSSFGVLLMYIFYLFRGNKKGLLPVYALWVAVITLADVINANGVDMFSIHQAWSFLAIIPIFLYNKKKGRSGGAWRWFFYVFYPAHILLLALAERAYAWRIY